MYVERRNKGTGGVKYSFLRGMELRRKAGRWERKQRVKGRVN